MIVSFSGNDGSGKSTLAKNLQKVLENAGFNVYYREEFDYFLLKYVLRLLPKKTVSNQTSSFVGLRDDTKKPSLLHRLWPYALFLDLLFEQLWLRIRYMNSVVIMDRYSHDFLMSFEYLNVSSNLIRFLFSLLPDAHVTYICIVEPKTAYNRKKHDHAQGIAFFETQTARYSEYAKVHGYPSIHTEGTLEDTISLLLDSWRSQLTDQSSMNNTDTMCTQGAIEDTTTMTSDIAKKIEVQRKKTQTGLDEWVRITSKLDISYALVKTVTPYESFPTDLDIVIDPKNHSNVQRELKKAGFSFHAGFGHIALTFTRDDLIPVDLHDKISWHNLTIIGAETILRNLTEKTYYNHTVSTPSPEYDLAIHMAHSLYQHHYTTWGELKIMIRLLREISELSCDLYDRSEFKWFYKRLVNTGSLLYPEYVLKKDVFEGKSIQVKPRKRIKLIFWHPCHLLRAANKWQAFDAVVYFYRRMRYYLNGRLPFNENWLNES